MIKFDGLEIPVEGHEIEIIEDRMYVPDDPIIPIIEGDGTGPDVTRAMQPVVDAAVHEAQYPCWRDGSQNLWRSAS